MVKADISQSNVKTLAMTMYKEISGFCLERRSSHYVSAAEQWLIRGAT